MQWRLNFIVYISLFPVLRPRLYHAYTITFFEYVTLLQAIFGNMPNGCKISFSKRFLIEFFELYRQQPCLWNKSDHGYIDKGHREHALDVLTRKMREVNQNANKDETIRKINTFRSRFNKERKRREIGDSSGTYPVYKPRLWYYRHLQFLQCDQTTSLSGQGVSNGHYQVVSKVHETFLPQI